MQLLVSSCPPASLQLMPYGIGLANALVYPPVGVCFLLGDVAWVSKDVTVAAPHVHVRDKVPATTL